MIFPTPTMSWIVDGRRPLVILLPARLEERHRDQPLPRQGVRRHLPVARLEDVQRQEHAREEDDVRKRKHGDDP
jgi:hypothetical protein